MLLVLHVRHHSVLPFIRAPIKFFLSFHPILSPPSPLPLSLPFPSHLHSSLCSSFPLLSSNRGRNFPQDDENSDASGDEGDGTVNILPDTINGLDTVNIIGTYEYSHQIKSNQLNNAL